MRFSIVATLLQHLSQPRLVLSHNRVRASGVEPGLQQRPYWTQPGILLIRSSPQKSEAPLPFLRHEPGVAQQPKMTRHSGLGYSQDSRQLAHVQTFLGEQPE
jgi:hypothetical protein